MVYVYGIILDIQDINMNERSPPNGPLRYRKEKGILASQLSEDLILIHQADNGS